MVENHRSPVSALLSLCNRLFICRMDIYTFHSFALDMHARETYYVTLALIHEASANWKAVTIQDLGEFPLVSRAFVFA